MNNKIIIDEKYNGPPNIANGGFVCGHVADHVGPCSELSLKKPTPLGKSLDIKAEEGQVNLYDGEELLVSGVESDLKLSVPAPPSYEVAVEASKVYRGHIESGVYNNCYVCGAQREDGMHIFTGAVPGDENGLLAGPWEAGSQYCEDGFVKNEFIHAALDCPGFYAASEDDEVALLGKFTTEITAKIPEGDQCVVIGWPISREGRKLQAGTAIFNSKGELVASAKAIWILINFVP